MVDATLRILLTFGRIFSFVISYSCSMIEVVPNWMSNTNTVPLRGEKAWLRTGLM
jgi:hypothetical protein